MLRRNEGKYKVKDCERLRITPITRFKSCGAQPASNSSSPGQRPYVSPSIFGDGVYFLTYAVGFQHAGSACTDGATDVMRPIVNDIRE